MQVEEREYRAGGTERVHAALEWGKENIGITSEEAELMEKFALQAVSVGISGARERPKKSSPAHAAHMVSTLIAFRRHTQKSIHRMNKDDIITAIDAFQTSDESIYREKIVRKKKAKNTIWQYILDLKMYLFWLAIEKKTKFTTDEIKKLIALPARNKNTFQDTDILTPDEINSVIQACDNARDRCYFSMLYDGMFRSKELAEMRWNELLPVTFGEDDQLFYRATTSGKTGEIRKPLLTKSTVYINEWKNQYPGDASGNNLVFISRDGRQFQYTTAFRLLDRIKRRLLKQGNGWAEKLALHQFRRASITHASNEGRPLAHVCQDAWGKSYSIQIERYNKPGQEDLDASKLEAAGIPAKRKYTKREKALEPHLCSCGTLCPPHMKFCPKCGIPLTEQAKEQVQDERSSIRAAGAQYVRVDDVQKMIQDALLAAGLKK